MLARSVDVQNALTENQANASLARHLEGGKLERCLRLVGGGLSGGQTARDERRRDDHEDDETDTICWHGSISPDNDSRVVAHSEARD